MNSVAMDLTPLNNTDSNNTGLNYSSTDGENGSDVNCNRKDTQTNDNNALTDFQAFMLLLPAFISLGFLGLPYIVKILGLWSGSAGLFLFGILNEFGCLVLVASAQRLTERTGYQFGDIGSVAEISMTLGPACLQPHAAKFRLLIAISILIDYGMYLPNLMALMNSFTQNFLRYYVHLSNTVSITVITVVLLPIYLTRRMKLLSFIATAGNIALVGLIVISFQYICQDIPDINTRPTTKLADFITLTTFMNDAMFSYGGIAQVLPIRDGVKNKKNFDGWNGVLGLGIMIVTCFHVCCGFYGYLKFGDMTKVNFLLNLPEDIWIYDSLKILSFLIVYCTSGMTVFVVVDTVWPPIQRKTSHTLIQDYGEYICRVVLLILSCMFTILVPELELLMSLTGSIGVHSTTLVTPYVIALLILYGEVEPSTLVDRCKRTMTIVCFSFLLAFGIYCMVTGTGVALYTTFNHIVL